MHVTTTLDINGYEVAEYKGMVRGIVVRSPTIAQGLLGGLKNIIGGKIGAYTEMCEQAREQAYEEMIAHATKLGADGVLAVRYDASSVESDRGAVEVLCYGTAVVLRKKG
jgi:uncharacterized protein YbjQ (UPF0145 family)